MPLIRKITRWILLIILILIGAVMTILFLRNTIPPRGFTSNVITSWLGVVARLLGARIKTVGTPLKEKTLFVSNHISWLDIMVLGYLTPVHFLSKLEVKQMPILGWLATRAGTLYINRGSSISASESCSEITDALKNGHNSLIFAEGTTTDGNIKKFHSRLMQSAIDAQAMVQPVAIFYPICNSQTGKIELNPATLFIGNMSMGKSANNIFRSPHIDVEVHYLPPISSEGKKRDEIAQYAYDEVVEAIECIKLRKPSQ